MRFIVLGAAALALAGCAHLNRFRTDISAASPSAGPEQIALRNNLVKAFVTGKRNTKGWVDCTPTKPRGEECIAFRTDASTQEVAAYLSSAYTLTDGLCDDFFRAANAAARHREFARAEVNDVGTLITAALGLAQAGSLATSAVASVTGFGDNLFRNYDTSYLVSPDLASLQPLVRAEQAQLRRTTKDSPPTTFADARSAALIYAEPCTYLGMKRLLTKSAQLLTTVKSERQLTGDDVRAIAATQPATASGAGGSGAATPAAALPAMRWGAADEKQAWTRATLKEVQDAGVALWSAGFTPADIAAYCPGYAKHDEADRQAFWAGLLSAMAHYETSDFIIDSDTLKPDGRTHSIGLLHLLASDRTTYSCDFLTDAGIKEALPNLRCGVRILAWHVASDGVIAKGDKEFGGRGAARYWGSMRVAAARTKIGAWTAAQPYCSAS